MSAPSIINPYFDEARMARFGEPDPAIISTLAEAGDGAGILRYIEERQRVRDRLAVRYAHAIPDQAALEALSSLAPLLEIGAGTGYWAWLLRQWGVDIVAFDTCPPTTANHANPYHRNATTVGVCWSDVEQGGPEQASHWPNRSLFLCWPPADATAEVALAAYTGQHIAFVGTNQPHIPTATPAFQAQLRRRFALQAIVPIPQWYAIDDRLTIWSRRKR